MTATLMGLFVVPAVPAVGAQIVLPEHVIPQDVNVPVDRQLLHNVAALPSDTFEILHFTQPVGFAADVTWPDIQMAGARAAVVLDGQAGNGVADATLFAVAGYRVAQSETVASSVKTVGQMAVGQPWCDLGCQTALRDLASGKAPMTVLQGKDADFFRSRLTERPTAAGTTTASATSSPGSVTSTHSVAPGSSRTILGLPRWIAVTLLAVVGAALLGVGVGAALFHKLGRQRAPGASPSLLDRSKRGRTKKQKGKKEPSEGAQPGATNGHAASSERIEGDPGSAVTTDPDEPSADQSVPAPDDHGGDTAITQPRTALVEAGSPAGVIEPFVARVPTQPSTKPSRPRVVPGGWPLEAGKPRARVHSELAPDGYVDADGILRRAYWQGPPELAPRLGDWVVVTAVDGGRLLAWPHPAQPGRQQRPGVDDQVRQQPTEPL